MNVNRPVGFEDMLHAIAAKLGIDSSSGSFDDETVQRLARFLRERSRYVWEFQFWPWGVTRTERRQFAPDWAIGTEYVAGDVVLATNDAYFVSVGTQTGNDPVADDGTHWKSLTAYRVANPGWSFVRLVEYEQDWYAGGAYASVDNVYEYDPRAHRYPRQVRFEHNEDGVVVTDFRPPARVWMQVRGPAPVFLTHPIYDPASSYAPGAVVFHAVDCWKARAAVDPGDEPGVDAVWERQVLPAALADVAVHAAYADELAAGEGALDKAQHERQVADAMLDELTGQTFAGSGRVRRIMRQVAVRDKLEHGDGKRAV
jgi:hypothetical protein